MKNKALDMLFDKRKELFQRYESLHIDLGLIDMSLENFVYLQKQAEISQEMQETHEHLYFMSRLINVVRNINEANSGKYNSQIMCEDNCGKL